MSNPDWNFEPLDDECENCLEECECDDDDDWEVYDDDLSE
jgi:hypothetical protein